MRAGGDCVRVVGGGDCLKYLKMGWNGKEWRGNKDFKKGESWNPMNYVITSIITSITIIITKTLINIIIATTVNTFWIIYFPLLLLLSMLSFLLLILFLL